MFETITSDVLVIGGGGAGIRAAIEADNNGCSVTLLCQGPIAKSGATPQAWPSYEAAFGFMDSRDNPEVHFEDTRRGGRFLGDETLIWALAAESEARVADLQHYNVKFEQIDDHLLQVHHPGQTYPRCLVIKGCGYGMVAGLYREAKKRSSIRMLADVIVTKLLQQDGRVIGAVAVDQQSGSIIMLQSKTTILATGGYQQLWKTTQAAPDLMGDGIALALQVGAELVDLEMALFYPTVLIHPYDEINGTLVQYEGLLGPEYIAGKLLNGLGNDFLPPGELPVRDILTRLIFDEIKQGRGTPLGGVYIDITKSLKTTEEVDALLEQLNSLPYHNLKDLGIDVHETPIQVSPGMHFTLGGIYIDQWGSTNVPGLFAAGEASGNLHGANRLSGNALAETQVFGARAGNKAAQVAKDLPTITDLPLNMVDAEADRLTTFFSAKDDGIRPQVIKNQIKDIMDKYVAMPRSRDGLSQALEEILTLHSSSLPRMVVAGPSNFNLEWQSAIKVSFMAQVSEAVILGALLREESRGHHQRLDFPKTDENWCKHTVVKKDGEQLISYTLPIRKRKAANSSY
jgi:fumarate reductase (CoM/CoB) subunit A